MVRYITGIDIGLLHLGMARIECQDDYSSPMVADMALVNLTCLRHDKVAASDCQIPHTKNACDRVQHLIQEYQDRFFFDGIEQIVIERQPPQGLVEIEQLLCMLFRNRAILVSPNTLQSYFGWYKTATYDQRKTLAVQTALQFIYSQDQWMLDHFRSQTNASELRLHDVCDAILLAVFQVHQHAKLIPPLKRLVISKYFVSSTPHATHSVSDILSKSPLRASSHFLRPPHSTLVRPHPNEA